MLSYHSKQMIYQSDQLDWSHGFITRSYGLNDHWSQRKETFNKLLNGKYKNLYFYTPKQQHGNRVKMIARINGKKHTVVSGCDAIITQKKALVDQCLYVKSADCVPIIITEFDEKLAAVIHSGWRGSLNNIVKQTVSKLKHLNALPANLKAIIGPSIGACCYDISFQRYKLFERAYPTLIKLITFQSQQKYYLNLSRLCYEQLLESGLKPKNFLIIFMIRQFYVCGAIL